MWFADLSRCWGKKIILRTRSLAGPPLSHTRERWRAKRSGGKEDLGRAKKKRPAEQLGYWANRFYQVQESCVSRATFFSFSTEATRHRRLRAGWLWEQQWNRGRGSRTHVLRAQFVSYQDKQTKDSIGKTTTLRSDWNRNKPIFRKKCKLYDLTPFLSANNSVIRMSLDFYVK